MTYTCQILSLFSSVNIFSERVSGFFNDEFFYKINKKRTQVDVYDIINSKIGNVYMSNCRSLYKCHNTLY